MLTPAHFAAGGAIAAKMPARLKWLALPVAFGSHYVLDAIPHYEQWKLMGRVLQLPVGMVYWPWVGPWSLAFIVLLGWVTYRAWRSNSRKWWIYVAVCGIAAGLPDAPNRVLPKQHPLKKFHNAMHAHHNWGVALQKNMTGTSVMEATRNNNISAWFYMGIAAAMIVEITVFVLGVRIIALAGNRIDKTQQSRAGPPDPGQE
ncbi:MAG: hypothetical protein ACLFWB_13285 [Armatimonadota bacterium]